MSVDSPGWYYTDGQLRYKDDAGWTERYKAVAGPRATNTPVDSEPTDNGSANSAPDAKQPRRRTSRLAIAVCAGLLGFGVGSGPPNGDSLDGWVSWATWATAKASQISATFSPPVPLAPAASVTQKVTVKQR